MSNNFNELLEKANNGDDKAQHSIASKYRYGLDIKQNTQKAVNWFEKSIEQGNMQARSDLYNMSKFLASTIHISGMTDSFLLPRIEGILVKYPDPDDEQKSHIEYGSTQQLYTPTD